MLFPISVAVKIKKIFKEEESIETLNILDLTSKRRKVPERMTDFRLMLL